jgi:hypothetical protein
VRAEWEPLFDISAPPYTGENGFSALVAIPFRDLPERGRQELEAILIPTAKLVPWLEERGWTLPVFLARAAAKAQGLDEVTSPRPSPEASTPATRPAGRPQKRAWPRIVQLVRQLAGEHPDWQKKNLAYEARSRASEEFSESELPSLATIQRHMADILKGGSG